MRRTTSNISFYCDNEGIVERIDLVMDRSLDNPNHCCLAFGTFPAPWLSLIQLKL
jgi:hypothetical protein